MTMLRTTMSMLGSAAGLATILAACDPQPRPDEPLETSFRGGGGWGCQTCGYSNSPFFGTLPIDRLRTGTNKDQGSTDLRLVALQSPAGVQHPARVEVQELVADTPAGPVQRGSLQGWSLVLDDGASQHLVAISTYEEHPDWVTGQLIPAYGLAYHDPVDPDHPLVNVCPGIGPDETSVVLITDELYDVTTKEVLPDQPGWVTLACRGHALMKLKFLGHDPHDDYGSNWKQRQAALKMVTADYCGQGHSFTAVGQPLAWVDELGNFPEEALPSILGVEAKWTAYGAVCLDEPRLVPRAEVEAQCSIPTCNGDMGHEGVQWVSVLPKP